MAADAFRLDSGEPGGPAVDLFGKVDVDSEFVFAESGRDVGMGNGIDVRIDPESDGSAALQRDGDLREGFELGFGLAVKAVNSLFERKPDLLLGFAYAGEDDRSWVSASGEYPVLLAA